MSFVMKKVCSLIIHCQFLPRLKVVNRASKRAVFKRCRRCVSFFDSVTDILPT